MSDLDRAALRALVTQIAASQTEPAAVIAWR